MVFIDVVGKGKPVSLDVIKEIVDSTEVVGLQAMSGEYVHWLTKQMPQHHVSQKYILYDAFVTPSGFYNTVDTSLTTADWNSENYSYGGLTFILNTTDERITTAYPSGSVYLHDPSLHSDNIYFAKYKSYDYNGSDLYLTFELFSSDGSSLGDTQYTISLDHDISEIRKIQWFPMVSFNKVFVYFLTKYSSEDYEEGVVSLNPDSGNYTILAHNTPYHSQRYEGWGQFSKSVITSSSDYSNKKYSGGIFWYETYGNSGGSRGYYYWKRFFDGYMIFSYNRDDEYDLGEHPKFTVVNQLIDNCTGNSVGAYGSSYDYEHAYLWAGAGQWYRGYYFKTLGISSDGSASLDTYKNSEDPDDNEYNGGWTIYNQKDKYNDVLSALWSDKHAGTYHVVRQYVDLTGSPSHSSEFDSTVPPHLDLQDGVVVRLTDNTFVHNGKVYSRKTWSQVGTVENFPSYSSIIAYDIPNAGVLINDNGVVDRKNFCITSEPKYVVTVPVDLTGMDKLSAYWVEQDLGDTYWKMSIVDPNDINTVLYDNVPKGEAIDINFGQVRFKFEVIYDTDYDTGDLFGYSVLWWNE